MLNSINNWISPHLNKHLIIISVFIITLAIITSTLLLIYKELSLTIISSLIGLLFAFLSFIVYRLIEENADQKKKLLVQSTKDELTGLSNRKQLFIQLSETVKKHLRAKQKTSILLIEIDNLITINENFGETEGNQILINVAYSLKNKLRITDHIYRFEDNKFAIIAFNTALKGTSHFAETLREHILQANDLIDNKITISIGVAQISLVDTARTWVNRANTSLQGARESGGNSTFLAIPENDGYANYDFEQVRSNTTNDDIPEQDSKIISLKSYRNKRILETDSSL